MNCGSLSTQAFSKKSKLNDLDQKEERKMTMLKIIMMTIVETTMAMTREYPTYYLCKVWLYANSDNNNKQ